VCFHSTLKLVAVRQKIALPNSQVEATVNIHPTADNGFLLSAALNVSVSGIDQKSAEELVTRAHQICPYSNAVRGNIDVSLTVNVE